MCDKSCSSSEDHPCKKRTDNRITKTDPSGCKTELPSELTCVTDKDNRREITGAVRKSSKPRTYVTSAQNEAVNVRCLTSANDADDNHARKEHYEHNDLDQHKKTSSNFSQEAKKSSSRTTINLCPEDGKHPCYHLCSPVAHTNGTHEVQNTLRT